VAIELYRRIWDSIAENRKLLLDQLDLTVQQHHIIRYKKNTGNSPEKKLQNRGNLQISDFG